jgi:hypothetical protein
MQKQIFTWIAVVVVIGAGVWVYRWADKPEVPVVGMNGVVSGSYSIEGIMALGKPYICNFEKMDGASKIVGTVQTDGQKIHGQFRIKTELVKTEFDSYLIVRDGDTYAWTSLAPIGYKSKLAKSASVNASPSAQSQIVGTKDKMDYNCKPWTQVDQSVFVPPTSIIFSEMKV